MKIGCSYTEINESKMYENIFLLRHPLFKNSLFEGEFKPIIHLDGKVEYCIMLLDSVRSKVTIIIFRRDSCL